MPADAAAAMGAGDSSAQATASAMAESSSSSPDEGSSGSGGASDSSGADDGAEAAHAGDGSGPEDSLFADHVQLWTFTADHPPMGIYIRWLRSVIMEGQPMEAGDSGDDVPDPYDRDSGVRWKLRDINYVVHTYEPPPGPQDPGEAVHELAARSAMTAGLAVLLMYSLYKFFTRPARSHPNGLPPLGSEPSGSTGPPRVGMFGATRAPARPPPATNEWGDRVEMVPTPTKPTDRQF